MITQDEVLTTVQRVEGDRRPYNRQALLWEKMWRLELFEKNRDDAAEQDGQEQVTLPTPFNVVNLAERLITTTPDIRCPSPEATDIDDSDAMLRQKWLKAMWQRANKQARRDVVAAAWWLALVRGRGVFDIRWVEDALPKRMRQRHMPLHLRTLDPLNCGFVTGELYTEVGFHKYTQTRAKAGRRYPEIKDKLYKQKEEDKIPAEEDEIDIIDYWWVNEEDGSIWNCIMVDEIFAKEPVETDYIDIPLVEFYGDDAPASTESHRSLSLLHAIKDTWPYMSTLASQIATGNMWYFWPHISRQNEHGAILPDTPVRPGETMNYPWGTKVEIHQIQPNVPIAERMMAIMSEAIQQSTFPGVMYGQEPGSLQAGYGVSLLSDAAKNRIQKPRRNLERAMELVNEIALGLVEQMGDGDTVSIWGDAPEMGGLYSCSLAKENINGYYDNQVTISPNVPMEEIQKMTLGLRAVQERIMSKQTYRNQFMKEVLPEDEQRRINLEQAFESAEYQPFVHSRTLQDYFGPEWEVFRKQWMDEFIMDQAARQAAAQKLQQEMLQPPVSPQGPGRFGPGGPMPPMGPGQLGPPEPEVLGPQSPAMLQGMAPPQMEGQLTPEVLGLPPGEIPPEVYQALVSEGMFPEEEAEQMMRSAMGRAGQ